MSNVPFAYDVVLNQITVNGCDPNTSTKDDFMIRAGAYDDPAKYVGLGLRKEFTDYILTNYGRKDDPSNPKSRVSVSQEMTQSILQSSPRNSDATLVIGLTNAYDTEMEAGGNKGTNSPLGVLSQVGISQTLSGLGIGSMTSYFPDASFVAGISPRIERTIPLSTSAWKGIASIASNLNNRQIALSAYFKDGDTVVTPLDSKGNSKPGLWYGRNYYLNLLNVISGGGSYELKGIEESFPTSRDTTIALPAWTCARYPVVDPEDIMQGVCEPGPVTDPTVLAGIRMLRRHLPAHLWDIRPTQKGLCLVPTKGYNSCYGTAEATPPTISNEVVSGSLCVEGGMTVACSSAGQRLRLDYDSAATGLTEKKQCVLPDGKIVRCMRYVSVCTRAAN
jgi:hypothetical protein